jgi:flagellar protein FliS
MPPHPLNAYRQTEVQSRSPLELVVLLYDGALRFLTSAVAAFERNDIPARREATARLLAIVSELQATLDVERGGDIAAHLDELYRYLTRRIVDATTTRSPEPLHEVRRLLEPLRDAWQTIARQETAASASLEHGIPAARTEPVTQGAAAR